MNNNLEIEDLVNERFQIKIEKNKDTIVKFIGMIDIKDSFNTLDPYFHKLHTELIKNNIKEITFDLLELQFLNSSGIKALINLISLIKATEKDNQYIIKILLNKNYSWQMDCFKVINILAKEIVKFLN